MQSWNQAEPSVIEYDFSCLICCCLFFSSTVKCTNTHTRAHLHTNSVFMHGNDSHGISFVRSTTSITKQHQYTLACLCMAQQKQRHWNDCYKIFDTVPTIDVYKIRYYEILLTPKMLSKYTCNFFPSNKQVSAIFSYTWNALDLYLLLCYAHTHARAYV